MTTTRRLLTTFLFTGAAVIGACTFHTGGSLLLGPGSSSSEPAPPPPPPAEPGGSAPAAPAASGAGVQSVEVITDDGGKQYQVQQGEKGEPRLIGCADGQREAFVDRATFPNIAGCLATWPGAMSLRASRASKACGDDVPGGACASPADACAPGWHVCAADGAVADLKQVSPEQCAHAGGGRFSAAMSHCTAQTGCQYDERPSASYPCFQNGWCSEPVCCGNDCGDFGSCRGGVWKDQTHIAQGQDQGCGKSTSRRAGGILCCKG